mmetsp:Transcript_30651/g.34944  ORF Transcript_30651/g.34944 Transcript_30651/m.34944 type:complete len:155 (+) Transcript_30651:88-552(+)|eukprot:CAMPEP_0194145514 /NCGR_PEP_ID=MMETSP0152-20130528/17479_1 /TAXON_ID=1049557 /ORGANISM="Thalassiothrix antarctica, Strain L6-D1" /LENGTH=154 /DNA_ID=CAMNT_0038845777 /DNA_START=46 /DNA_END=510 /DNA_ORIENTATION=-
MSLFKGIFLTALYFTYIGAFSHSSYLSQRTVRNNIFFQGLELYSASLRPSGGDDEIDIPDGGSYVLDDNCVIEEEKGKYYCIVSDDEETTFIGKSALTKDVRYLLGDGMKIKTSSEKEFDVSIEDTLSDDDKAMMMVFEAMKAGFPSAADLEDL